MVDIHIRELADFWVLLTHRGHARVYKTKMGYFKSGKIRTPFLGEITVGLPSKPLVEAYEAKRKELLETKYDQYLLEVKKQKEIHEPRNLEEESNACMHAS